MFSPTYTVEGFAALPVLDGLNPDRLLRSVGIVYTTYSKEGHAVTALFELVGLNPDRLRRSVGIVILMKVEGNSIAALFELVGLNPDNKINYLIKENGFKEIDFVHRF